MCEQCLDLAAGDRECGCPKNRHLIDCPLKEEEGDQLELGN